ncbi:MAG: TdeIII family type II restriction endonuclease [Bacillota bacterium]
MNEATINRVIVHLSEFMQGMIRHRCEVEPFDERKVSTKNPFGAALVPMEIWKGSYFERSFVTKMGRGVFERIAQIVAQGSGARTILQHSTRARICTWRLEKIDQILAAQRTGNGAPDWNREVSEILALNNDAYREVETISDLFVERPDGTREFYCLKTVKPNLDQTEIAKRNMLYLTASDPRNQVFFGLPYNPAGEGKPYRDTGFTFPFSLFRMDDDPCVLIGGALWNRLGASDSVYDELLAAFRHVGSQFAREIRERYLGLH